MPTNARLLTVPRSGAQAPRRGQWPECRGTSAVRSPGHGC